MAIPNSDNTDFRIVNEVRLIYHSPLMHQIRGAHSKGKSMTVVIRSYTIQYEPLQFSGMTAFPTGFVIGKEAFASEDELKKTLLHEMYRLCHSEIGKGGDAHRTNISAETNAAFQFAERSHHLV